MDHLIICDSVFSECSSMIPRDMSCTVVPFALHSNPRNLKAVIQEHIDQAPGECEVIRIGFGLCSNSTLGLVSDRHTLLLPRVHDCIALFLGSQQRLAEQGLASLYVTRRYAEAEDGTYHLLEYDRYAQRYGSELAKKYIGMVIDGYRKALLIDTGEYPVDRYRQITRQLCTDYCLQYGELAGSRVLMKKMLTDDGSDEQIIRKRPSEPVGLDDYSARPQQNSIPAAAGQED
ncbi:MAG: DUF1638 domain-containing protein [Spirochaetia bacterium]|nr:DUF1638 domain-containing protein [Spirochaetia bacterium]